MKWTMALSAVLVFGCASEDTPRRTEHKSILGTAESLSVDHRLGPPLPASSRPMTALREAQQYELFSLDPRLHRGPEPALLPGSPVPVRFQGWKVLGQATVTDMPTRKRLNDAIQASAMVDEGKMFIGCFIPRHGVRVTREGKVTDFVVCFECKQVKVYDDGQRIGDFFVTKSPESTFDEVLRKAGVPLADKSH